MAGPRQHIAPLELMDFSALEDDDAPSPIDEGVAMGAPTNLTQDDVDAAHAAGLESGRAAAAADAQDEIAQALRAVETAMREAADAHREALDLARRTIADRAGAVIEAFANNLSAAREIDAALDLLQQAIAAPEAETAAALAVSAQTYDTVSTPLRDAIERAGAAGFITLEADNALAPGEVKIAFRAQAPRLSRTEIETAVSTLFDAPAATRAP